MGRSKRTKVFISYSHKDAAALERLQVHLRPLERWGIVERWDDTKIKVGQEWRAKIVRALSEARVAILLISADFLASDFVDEDELPPILLAQKEEGLEVLPVILGACLFERSTLSRFKTINKPGKHLLGLSSTEQDEVWAQLANRVAEICEETNEPMPLDGSPTDVLISEVFSDSVPRCSESFQDGPVEPPSVTTEPLDSEDMSHLKRLVQLSATEKVANTQLRVLQDFSEELGEGVLLQMAAISGGEFLMGSPPEEKGWNENEEPQHRVHLITFGMGKYPVTQLQWREVSKLPEVDIKMPSEPSFFRGNMRPVEQVSWYEAFEFCARLSLHTGKEYRLPSEAEWEYACRAGTTEPFSFGKTLSADFANYDTRKCYGNVMPGDYREQTTSVYKFKANNFGLHDMHGNVWEWCADWWHENYDGFPPKGTPWINDGKDERVLRGGSWCSYPEKCRSAYRRSYDPDRIYKNIGFRVACSVLGTFL